MHLACINLFSPCDTHEYYYQCYNFYYSHFIEGETQLVRISNIVVKTGFELRRPYWTAHGPNRYTQTCYSQP